MTSYGSTPLIYTPEQRMRRDSTVWTVVQGVLAPLQFFVFLVSVILIVRALWWQGDLAWAQVSVVVKTALLYAIMVTGCIWEKVVFGQYLFAQAFFWEDVVSMGVMVLHTAYLVAWWTQSLAPAPLLTLALAAYFIYFVNAVQFLWKLRQARRQGPASTDTPSLAVSPPQRGQVGHISQIGQVS
ncbi:MAG: 2-vinyl bacteriochlorophyllide hydratase [Pseudomonadota bacterium]|jgi:3-vinyl bacteriochlorophyllide hydratase